MDRQSVPGFNSTLINLPILMLIKQNFAHFEEENVKNTIKCSFCDGYLNECCKEKHACESADDGFSSDLESEL